MALVSHAHTVWEGTLFEGSGTVFFDSSNLPQQKVTWKARAEEHGGVTSPEELIAAAHATCYSMALSNTLAKAGHPPASLDVEATATFVPGTGITQMVLRLDADVPDISQEAFQEAAESAKENCPVSQALKGNVPITLEANLR